MTVRAQKNENQDQETDPASELGQGHEILLDLENGLYIVRSEITALREQDINAKSMPNQMFIQLSENIKNRGTLESLPFTAKTAKHVEIVSGHHRIRAAKQAHLTHVIHLMDSTGLSKDAIRGKQLAHNSIDGVDEDQIIKQIFDMIKDADSKIESFIDPKAINIPTPDHTLINNMLTTELESTTMMFIFLKHQLENFEKAIALISEDVNKVAVIDIVHYDKFRETLTQVKKIDDVSSLGMVISKMCDIVLAHYSLCITEQKEDADKDKETPNETSKETPKD